MREKSSWREDSFESLFSLGGARQYGGHKIFGAEAD